ncbi:hypothetical protein [Streptomyces sp. NPDC002790]
MTSAEPDPLAARFIGGLLGHGMRVPRGVQTQLTQDAESTG